MSWRWVGEGGKREDARHISLAVWPLRRFQDFFADCVDYDQTAQNVQSDLDIHCPKRRYFSA